MNRSADKPDPLAALLRRAAQQETPAFSPQLHARIMAQVRQVEPQEMAMRPSVFLSRPIILLAAALLVAWMLWWAHGHYPAVAPAPMAGGHNLQPTRGTDVTPTPLALPPFDTMLAHGLASAQTHLDEGRFAYLDRDAQSLARYVIDQLDVVPRKP